MIRVGCVMILAMVILPSTARATPIWSLPAPEGWTDVSAEMRQEPAWVGQRTKADEQGRNIALVAYQAPNDETLTAYAYTVPGGEASMDVLDARIRASRDQHRELGTEISHRRLSSRTTIDVRQNIEVGERVIYTRLLAGFDRKGQMHLVTALCQTTALTCMPLLLSLTLDEAQLVRLPVGTASKRAAAYRKGQIAGGILLVVLVGLWLRSLHRRRTAAARARSEARVA